MITKKAVPVGILFLLLVYCNLCRAYDSLIFRSEFESRLVNGSIDKTSSDYFSLFLAINADSAECALGQTAMNTFYSSLDLVARAIALKAEQIKGEAKAIERLHAYAETFPFLKSKSRTGASLWTCRSSRK